MTVHNIRHGDASDGVLAEAVGGRLSRVDGPAKITGAARYAVEQQLEGLAYAVLVESTIASGKVRAIDTAAAEAAPGVLKVLTPDTIISLRTAADWFGTPPPDKPSMPRPEGPPSVMRPVIVRVPEVTTMLRPSDRIRLVPLVRTL